MKSIITAASIVVGLGVLGYWWTNRKPKPVDAVGSGDMLPDGRLMGDAAESWIAELPAGSDGDAD